MSDELQSTLVLADSLKTAWNECPDLRPRVMWRSRKLRELTHWTPLDVEFTETGFIWRAKSPVVSKGTPVSVRIVTHDFRPIASSLCTMPKVLVGDFIEVTITADADWPLIFAMARWGE